MNTKKYTYKYNYLKLELDEIQEKQDEYLQQWAKFFGPYLAKKPVEAWKNEETGELRFEEDKPEDSKELLKSSPKKEEDKNLKKIYKKLSIKVHPDKGGRQKDFIELKRFYEEDNLMGMLGIAANYDIDIRLDDSHIDYFDKSCEGITREMKDITQSVAWDFFTSKPGKRKLIAQIFATQQKIEIPEEELNKLINFDQE